MQNSPKLSLPYILPSQAQKHVTHNEALRMLDGIVHISFIERDMSTPPVAPAEGDCYTISDTPTGDWSLHPKEVACFQDGAWMFSIPKTGWLAWDQNSQEITVWDGANWIQASKIPSNIANLDGLGILAAPDPTNRLSVKSDVALFSHDDATPGTGDMRIIINKAADTQTASILFQDNWSGRAEFGLTGDDDWHVKVSPDNVIWHEAIVVNRATGEVQFPAGVTEPNTGSFVQNLVPIPSVGDAMSSIWRLDTSRDPFPRTATLGSVSTDILNLTTGIGSKFFSPQMTGVAYLQIENISKNPRQNAWIKAKPSETQLQVTDQTDISTWANGDTIQLGQSVGNFVDQYAILDISPMIQFQFGSTFRQKGIWVYKSFAGGSSTTAGLRVTPNGASGSVVGLVDSLEDGASRQSQGMIPCFDLSPISNSNLVYIREVGSAGDIGICGVTLGGLYV